MREPLKVGDRVRAYGASHITHEVTGFTGYMFSNGFICTVVDIKEFEVLVKSGELTYSFHPKQLRRLKKKSNNWIAIGVAAEKLEAEIGRWKK